MKAQKIKMELELSPENALIVVIFLHTTVLYNNQFYNMLTEVSKNESMNIAQNIVNQICTMTYYKELRIHILL